MQTANVEWKTVCFASSQAENRCAIYSGILNQDDNFASPQLCRCCCCCCCCSFSLLCAAFCFVAKINRCVREHTMQSHPTSTSTAVQVKMLKTYNSCSGRKYNCRRMYTRMKYISTFCGMYAVQHNMRWVFVNTKCIIIINESEISAVVFLPLLFNRKF